MPDERLLARLTDEISRLHQSLDRLVRVDVYEAHRAAMIANMSRIESDVDELRKEKAERDNQQAKEEAERDRQRAADQAANKRMVWGAALAMFGTAIASVLVQVIFQ